ncbi:hypothetical protein PoB_001616600 [Plakobranchus ocellatus]|uniref:Uncharacterized protein n=1 Tax=Plakobranchus ocellatus TaxID=259542 RepID=A0AAV3YR86_9GAST|nr:hypothetical protein PoB_001616600 [Plakobranchus ocellatus]
MVLSSITIGKSYVSFDLTAINILSDRQLLSGVKCVSELLCRYFLAQGFPLLGQDFFSMSRTFLRLKIVLFINGVVFILALGISIKIQHTLIHSQAYYEAVLTAEMCVAYILGLTISKNILSAALLCRESVVATEYVDD